MTIADILIKYNEPLAMLGLVYIVNISIDPLLKFVETARKVVFGGVRIIVLVVLYLTMREK